MLNFCTLFNLNYLSRGLALYFSLKKNNSNFHLFVFAFDTETQKILTDLKLENLTVISLRNFENDELLRIKKTRTATEYCWTCTPSTVLYILNTYKVDSCTYIDADTYFYNDPQVLFQENIDKSVIITPHRYIEEFKYFEKTSGVYCVQFVYFKNNKEGREVLGKWVKDCNNWCYARVEDGKFGDQKYLDYWPEKYSWVHILEHEGGGLAPWNQLNYDLRINTQNLIIKNKLNKKEWKLIFYHFHGIKMFSNNYCDLSDTYKIDKKILKHIYKPYIKELLEIESKYLQGTTLNIHGKKDYIPKWRFPLKIINRKIKGLDNIISLNSIGSN